jgi:glycosyltransferase involved in cell wall biosynthesis
MPILVVSSWSKSKIHPTKGIFIDKQVGTIHYDRVYNIVESDECQANHVVKRGNLICIKIFRNQSYLSTLKLLISYFKILFHILYIKKVQINLIVINVIYHAGIFIYPFLLFSNRRLIVNEHWSGFLKKDGSFAKLNIATRVIIRNIFQLSDLILVPSKYLKFELIKLFDLPGAKIKVMYNIVDNEKSKYIADSIRRRFISNRSENNLFSIGEFDDLNKNICKIIEYSNYCTCLKSVNIINLVIGSGRRGNCHLEQKAHNSNLLEITNVNNKIIQKYYLSSTIFVSLSDYETFSIALFQSLLYGKPVLCTSSGGPIEYLSNRTSRVVELDNFYLIVDKLNNILKRRTAYNDKYINIITKNVLAINDKNLGDYSLTLADKKFRTCNLNSV